MIHPTTHVDVCVCTMQRESLSATIDSLGAQVLPSGLFFRLIVADNDETPSARERAEQAAAAAGLTLTYVHCPARNISLARNACLEAATAEWVAFIDDDEIAAPGWVAQLVAAAHRTKADVVLGPVKAVYPPGTPGWMRKGDFHSTKPVLVNDRIITGYTCNVLMKRQAPALRGQRFRVDLGRSGGEDTEFFHRVAQAGGTIVFAPHAVVEEPVEPARARLPWLLRRRFRSGQTHGELLLSASPPAVDKARQAAIAGAKMTTCFAAAVATGPGSVKSLSWFLRGILHAGVVARLVGRQGITLYGKALENGPRAY
jgi:succinoglycan biosynthesis protein ExoM